MNKKKHGNFLKLSFFRNFGIIIQKNWKICKISFRLKAFVFSKLNFHCTIFELFICITRQTSQQNDRWIRNSIQFFAFPSIKFWNKIFSGQIKNFRNFSRQIVKVVNESYKNNSIGARFDENRYWKMLYFVEFPSFLILPSECLAENVFPRYFR